MRSTTLIAVLLCAACAQEERERPTGDAQPPPGEKTVAMEVAWPEVATLDRDVLHRLTPASRKAVAASRVPVLVANDPALAAKAIVMAKPAFTAISARADGVTVSLHIHRLAHRYPHIPRTEGNRLIRGHKGFITQNEAIWSASWTENGITYDLDVECGTLPDPRCDDESYLLSVADSLRYVGGQRHATEVLP